jgi:hypothetical protein
MTDDVVLKDELRSAIEARKELSDEMEPAMIDAFVARIERRLVDRADQGEKALQRKRNHQKEMVLGSMGISIPLLAIAAVFTGLAGVIVVCVALLVIAVISSPPGPRGTPPRSGGPRPGPAPGSRRRTTRVPRSAGAAGDENVHVADLLGLSRRRGLAGLGPQTDRDEGM